MRCKKGVFTAFIVCLIVFFGISFALETGAWARAGGGGSSGSRGSRSFSAPSSPPFSSSSPSPGFTPRTSPGYGSPYTSPGYGSSGSPFWSGVAGGLAGGFLGNMLFGGRVFGAPMGGFGGSGIGLFDLLIIGGLIYFGFKFFKRRGGGGGYYEEPPPESPPQYQSGGQQTYSAGQNDVERGLEEIMRFDPSFRVDSFKETAEDIFFRIQAGWMNRSLEGVENLLTRQMADYFSSEFAKMRQQGRINRLENIAVRKVEPSEVWQESGSDYITVLFTANLLDYTVDESGKVIEGDKLNPVKFQEYWTFSRDIGSRQWQLSGINQPGEPSAR